MSGTPLELAAFVCLGVAIAALYVRLSGKSLRSRLPGRPLKGQWRVIRFRRKLKSIDSVLETWARQVGADDPARGRRLTGRDQSPRLRPASEQIERGEDDPPAAAF